MSHSSTAFPSSLQSAPAPAPSGEPAPARSVRMANRRAGRLWLSAAVSMAMLAGCGGGSDGGSTPVPSPAPAPVPTPAPSDGSSAACFNQADLHEGTRLEVEQEFTASGQTARSRSVTITRGREAFAGANPVRLLRTQYFDNTTVSDRQYIDFVDGKIVRYGTRNGGEDAPAGLGYAYNDPPVREPVMQAGQTIPMDYVVRSVEGANDQIRSEQVITGTHTYDGRVSLNTPMGTIAACKFTGVAKFRQVDGSDLTQVQENWIAAEGVYRGQLLKFTTRTGDQVGTMTITRIVYAPQ